MSIVNLLSELHMQTEVVIIDNNDVFCRDQAVADHCAGLTELGAGLYSRVYGSEGTPYVVKIMNGRDKGYRTFIRAVTELGKGFVNLPKIHRVINYRRADSYYDEDEVPGESSCDVTVFYIEKLVEVGHGDRLWRHITRVINILYGVIQQPETIKDFRPEHQDLITLLLIAQEQTGLRWFDLHTGNIMVRGGHFVITDPLAGQ